MTETYVMKTPSDTAGTTKTEGTQGTDSLEQKIDYLITLTEWLVQRMGGQPRQPAPVPQRPQQGVQ